MLKFLFTLFVIFSLPHFAIADVDKRIDTPKNREILKKVESAYNSMKTIKSEFAQFNSKIKDDLQTGTLYISRPGKMRLVYQKGSPLEFYAVNGYLVYHDKDLKEVNYFHLDQTPVSWILKEKLKFDDPEFLVTSVQDVLDEYKVSAIKSGAEELGTLTLIIDKETLTLKQWEIVDMEGIKSTVSLFNIKQNVSIDNSLFMFQNPYINK